YHFALLSYSTLTLIATYTYPTRRSSDLCPISIKTLKSDIQSIVAGLTICLRYWAQLVYYAPPKINSENTPPPCLPISYIPIFLRTMICSVQTLITTRRALA